MVGSEIKIYDKGSNHSDVNVLHTFTCHMCLIPVSAVEKKTVNEDEDLKRLCD